MYAFVNIAYTHERAHYAGNEAYGFYSLMDLFGQSLTHSLPILFFLPSPSFIRYLSFFSFLSLFFLSFLRSFFRAGSEEDLAAQAAYVYHVPSLDCDLGPRARLAMANQRTLLMPIDEYNLFTRARETSFCTQRQKVRVCSCRARAALCRRC
jgi:hypothetical protein